MVLVVFFSLMAVEAVHLGINPNQYSFPIQDCPKAKITIVFGFSHSSTYTLWFLEHDAASLSNSHPTTFTTNSSWTIPPFKWDQYVVSKLQSHYPVMRSYIPEEQRPQKLSNPFCFHYSQVVRTRGTHASCVTCWSDLSCGIVAQIEAPAGPDHEKCMHFWYDKLITHSESWQDKETHQ